MTCISRKIVIFITTGDFLARRRKTGGLGGWRFSKFVNERDTAKKQFILSSYSRNKTGVCVEVPKRGIKIRNMSVSTIRKTIGRYIEIN